MKKHSTKIKMIAFILCAVMMLTCLQAFACASTDASAAKKVFTSDGLIYKITSSTDDVNTVSVVGCEVAGDIIIPGSITYKKKVYNVTAVENAAFAFKDISFAVVPEGVVSIGESAFANCTVLEAVVLPSTIESIGTGAFSYCPKLEKIDLGGNDAYYVFDNGILYSADRSVLIFATDACEKDLKTARSVKEIAPFAFEGNKKIESFTASGALTKICEKAFIDSSVKKVYISKSVNEIEGNPFIYCAELESITVAKKNVIYRSLDGLLLSKDRKTLISANAAKGKFTIPSKVRNIGAFAAAGNMNITSLVFDKKTESVSEYAFCDCTSMEKVYVASRSLSLPKNGNVFTNTPFFMEINVPYNSGAGDKDSLESLLKSNSPKGVVITSR